MAARTRPPFRADHVGSLLRPPQVMQAREDFQQGRIDAQELRGIEDEAIRDVVRKQEAVGLRSATDGEFRRASWHMDFIYQLGGITKVTDQSLKVQFHNERGDIEFAPPSLHVDAPIALQEPIFAEDFRFVQECASTATPKLTIPSPSMVHYRGGRASIDPAVYPDLDGFFMEWDDERSGGFEPLRFVPKGKVVVLGLVTTKRGELESKDELKRRIDEASKYVDGDQLCLSPQCGFSSTSEGNELTREDQLAKLALIVETAAEVWG